MGVYLDFLFDPLEITDDVTSTGLLQPENINLKRFEVPSSKGKNMLPVLTESQGMHVLYLPI